MKTNDIDLTVANTIYQQLGGNKASAMIGIKDLVGSPRALQFGWKVRGAKNEANKAVVVLDPSDTYTVKFFSVRAGRFTERGVFSGVYNDQLVSLFERETGLALRL
jgi:hypothetical protein